MNRDRKKAGGKTLIFSMEALEAFADGLLNKEELRARAKPNA